MNGFKIQTLINKLSPSTRIKKFVVAIDHKDLNTILTKKYRFEVDF